MSHVETHGRRRSLAERRAAFWEAESRGRRLEPWESEEQVRAIRQMQRDQGRFIRAQAASPPRKRGKK